MNEFLKLKWETTTNPSYLEKQACSFIPDEVLLDSYIYQHLKKRFTKQTKSSTLDNEAKFFPGNKYLPFFQRKSSLTANQQESCLNAMKILSQNKNPNQLNESENYQLKVFSDLNALLARENAAFIGFARKAWESDKIAIAKLQNNLYRYAWTCFRKKIKGYLEYGHFYREECSINMTYNEANNALVEVNCIKNLLELGTLARFSHPSLKFECRLSAQTLPRIPTNIRSYSKLPVSQDNNVREILEENDIDVVISSSGLKRLLDNTDPKAQWTIPVKVEMVKINKGNETLMKKVVFIDKPFVENHKDPLDLKYYSMKRLVKTNFCQYEAFSFEKIDTYPDEKLANFNQKLIELEKKINGTSDEQNCGEDENGQENSEKTGEEEGEICLWKKTNKGKPDIIHHNVNYRLWNFKKIVNCSTLMKNPIKNTELNLLVRSKLDACETTPSGALQPVIVKPKIELQLQYGANIPTKSELSREWTSLFFRPFSNLYRVRMHWETAEVVSVERCTMQKVLAEANSLYQYNPHLGLGILNNLLIKLMELETGNYLLVHQPKHEFFVGVWVECESSLGKMNLDSEHKNCEIDIDIKRSWVPIDLNYILPIHEFQKRPPGCFNAAAKVKGAVGMKKKKPGPQPKRGATNKKYTK